MPRPFPQPILRGTPIPGSKYRRVKCAVCGDPIRTSGESVKCSDCDPRWRGRPGVSAKHYNVDIEWGGYCDTPINE